jgi:phosphoribosyl-AMP cyclohydrolase
MEEFAYEWSKLKKRTVDGIGGLVLAIAQDAKTKQVLMAAYANREAVEKTRKTGFAHYYSTSRKRLWKKGETSGSVQKVLEVLVDCDADALLYVVEPKGPSCHTGEKTCFYRKMCR